MDWLLIGGGLALLFLGGETTLRGAVSLARNMNVSPAMIGLTVIGFGTSMPELFVTVETALSGNFGLAAGNVIGSNISNVLLILGGGGLLTPLVCNPATLRRDGVMMAAATVLLTLLALTGEILPWQGFLMVVTLTVYIIWSWKRDDKGGATAALHQQEAEELRNVPRNLPLALLLVAIGLAALIGGAEVLVIGAVSLANDYNVPESVIGLTLVALGTSLPELAATFVAAWRGHAEVAVANVMGSCMFNILLIMGATAMITPLHIPADMIQVDIWVMLGAVAVLMPMLFGDFRICRRDAAILLSAYVIYIGSLAMRAAA